MPIYEYQCKVCGHQFDVMRSIKEADSPIACKHCDSVATTRKLSRCYSHSASGASQNTGGGCGSCQGGSCSSCRH